MEKVFYFLEIKSEKTKNLKFKKIWNSKHYSQYGGENRAPQKHFGILLWLMHGWLCLQGLGLHDKPQKIILFRFFILD